MAYKDLEKKKATKRAYRRAYDRAHRKEINTRSKRYRAIHLPSPEQRAQKAVYDMTYREAHRTKRSADHKAYSVTHHAAIQANRIAWAKAHPENVVASSARRRARKHHAPINDFTAQQWKILQETQQHRCAYCGKRCKDKLTQDHITPLSKGGNHTLSNIIGACHNCNSKKHAGPVLTPIQPYFLLHSPGVKSHA